MTTLSFRAEDWPLAEPFRFAFAFLPAALRRRCGLSASSRYSWNDSRMQIAKYSGSGICSRQEVGEMMMRPS